MAAVPTSARTLDAIRATNNFDGLRLAAAVAVIVGHGYVLGGHVPDLPTVLGVPPHVLGVAVFFAISGWLITGSWERSRSVAQFVTSRVLRIMPLLILVVLVSVLVLGPLLTTLSLGEYGASPQTWRYLVNIVMLPADGLPGVFATVSYPGVVNGSVWTLRAEVLCYGAVLLLGLLPRRVQTPGLLAWLFASVVLAVVPEVRVAGSSISAAAGAWIFFAVAALMRLHVPRRALRVDVAIGVLVAWQVLVLVLPGSAVRISWVALPYAVVSIGLGSWPVVRRAARWGDLSYGMYLWAFPVAQILNQSWGHQPAVLDIVAVAAICAVLAFTSWHLLERPALDARWRLPWFARTPTTEASPAAGSAAAA